MPKNIKRRRWTIVCVVLMLACFCTVAAFGSSMPNDRHSPKHLVVSDLSVVRSEAPTPEDSEDYKFYTVTFNLQNQGVESLDLSNYMFHYETKSSNGYVAIIDPLSSNYALYNEPTLPCGASCQVQHLVRISKHEKLSDLYPLTLTYDSFEDSVSIYTLEQELFTANEK